MLRVLSPTFKPILQKIEQFYFLQQNLYMLRVLPAQGKFVETLMYGMTPA